MPYSYTSTCRWHFLLIFNALLPPLLLNSKLLSADKPNVLIILADDLGYSDLGCYGGEIETPNLDALASNGLRYTQFYNTARCWPTRGSLLTGYYAQQIRRDNLPGIKSGGKGTRQDWAVLLPKRLNAAGYKSYSSGKWHIDGKSLENGFDHAYRLEDQSRFFNPNAHFVDDVKLPAIQKGTDYYGTIAVTDYAIEHLKQHAQKTPDAPFFQYVAYAAPHFPLHALPQDIAKYKDRFTSGWNEIRQQHWQRIQQMGLLQANLSPPEWNLGPPYDFPNAFEILGPGEVNRPKPWNELTPEQQSFQAAKMEIHAAMIDRMDQEIGRLLSQLKEMQAFDNTLILFLSDNGASAEIMVRGDGHDPQAAMGSAETYLCLGPGWSTCSNTPFRRHKTWVHEGGISTPLIAHWPDGITAKGELRHNVGHVIDVVPTLLEVTGSDPSSKSAGEQAPDFPGTSLVPTFTKDHAITHEHLWWFHDGHRALRQGDWKVVAAKDEPWELYNLKEDRTETKNLAKKHPEKVRQLSQLWEQRQQEFINLAKR